MSPLLTKILVITGILLTFGILTFIVYNQIQLKNQQTAIQTTIVAQQQLVDGIVRSQSQYATKKDIEDFAKDNNVNLKAIQDNLSKLSAQVAAINIITANSNGQNGTNLPSTNVGPNNPNPTPIAVNCPGGTTVNCPNPDTFGYLTKQQNLDLSEDFTTLKIPFGTVGFSAWQQKPWDIHILPRQYNVATVVGTDENQRQYFYNKFSVNVAGKDYEVPIKTATTKQEVPEAKFSFWNPRLFLTTGGGVNLTHLNGEVNLGATVGIMSYGRYKNNPDISVLQVGAGYQFINKAPSLIITPVAVNVGHLFPGGLVNNTYIGPTLQFDLNGNVIVGLNASVGF